MHFNIEVIICGIYDRSNLLVTNVPQSQFGNPVVIKKFKNINENNNFTSNIISFGILIKFSNFIIHIIAGTISTATIIKFPQKTEL